MVLDHQPQAPAETAIQCAASESTSLPRASQARRAGLHSDALAIVQCVLQRYPEDADAWFELGAIKSAQGERAEARRAWLRALDLAPANDDARMGLARLAYWDGDAAAANAWLASISQSRLQDAEGLELQEMLRKPPAGAGTWRIDLGVAQSFLSANLPDWTDLRAAVSRRSGPAGYGLALEHARRFDREDLYVEAYLSRDFAGAVWSLALGGAPDADFRPETSVRAGVETYGRQWQLGAFLSHAEYAVGPVDKLDLRAARNLGDVAQVLLQGILVSDENGETHIGYALGANWKPAAGFAVDAGWSDAVESSDGATADVQAITLGATFEPVPDIRIRTGVAHETRSAYDRTELSVGLVRTF